MYNFHFSRSFWSKKWPFNSNIFNSIMSGRRLELLMSYLHLNDSQKMPERDSLNYDKLYKVCPLLDRVVNAFRNAWIPRQNLSVDESIIAFKGRLSWVQYMPKKPHKWGIKAWVLADSSNGYVTNFKLYTGKFYKTIICEFIMPVRKDRWYRKGTWVQS